MSSIMIVLEALHMTVSQSPVLVTTLALVLGWYAVKHASEWVVTIKWLYPSHTHLTRPSPTITRYTPDPHSIRTATIRLLWRRNMRRMIVQHHNEWDTTTK